MNSITTDNRPKATQEEKWLKIAGISEHVAEEPGRDLGYQEGEGRMTKSQLHHISEYAAELHEMIEDGDDLPEWIQGKVAVMASDIGKIKHYLEYKLKRMNDDAPMLGQIDTSEPAEAPMVLDYALEEEL